MDTVHGAMAMAAMAATATSITMSSWARQGSGVSADALARELARQRMAAGRLAVGCSATCEKIISLS